MANLPGDYLIVRGMAPNFNYYGIQNFLNLIIDKAIQENYPVYDFEKKNKLDIAEIKARLGYRVEKIMVENYDGKVEEKTIEFPIDIHSIQSIIFHEEWYMDPITLRIQKKLIGLSPVRYYYRDDDIDQLNPLKKIVFTIYFDEANRF